MYVVVTELTIASTKTLTEMIAGWYLSEPISVCRLLSEKLSKDSNWKKVENGTINVTYMCFIYECNYIIQDSENQPEIWGRVGEHNNTNNNYAFALRKRKYTITDVYLNDVLQELDIEE